MKTKSKLSAYILRGSTTALLFSCVLVALCLATHVPEQRPKALPPQNNAAFGANARQSTGSASRLVIRADRPRTGGSSCGNAFPFTHDFRAGNQNIAVHVLPIAHRRFDHAARQFRRPRQA